MNTPIPERSDEVLQSVVRTYVGSARPVGSRVVARGLDLSSATIRSIFSRMEERGLLTHPHPSAGRIPTDLGYRRYVDRLLRTRRLNAREEASIEAEYRRARAAVDVLMRQTARILSAMTRLAGVAVTHVPGGAALDRFRIVPLSPHQVMVLLVAGDVWVEQEVVRLPDPLDPRELVRVVHLLNRRFAGRPLVRIREELLEELERSRSARLLLLKAAADLLDNALRLRPEHVFVEGTSRLVEQPEFREPGALEGVLKVVDDREALAGVLEGRWDEPGLSVVIGRELGDLRLTACSLVHVPCRFAGGPAGVLGVLGPTRMPYDRVAGLVQHVASVVGGLLGKGEA